MEDAGKSNLPARKIGANDLIAISVYDAPELTRTIRVDSDGSISLPLLKRSIGAEGLLPRELETVIADALREGQLLVEPVVKVTVVEYNSHPISVAGAVRKPLTFQAETSVTLLEALARAEGLTEVAGTEILVTRPEQALILRIPVKGLIDTADPALNVKLEGGEEIRVPEAGRIYVLGNVKRPGAFTLRDGSQPSVLKLIALAEGITPYALKQAYIYRQSDGAQKTEIPIEMTKILKREAPDVPLQANDILYIPDNTGRRATLTALEKVALLSGAIGAAAVYAGAR
jgi:polysaccharide export outer membrane protein